MSFREDVFQDLQNDLCCPLLADEYFANINVIDYRKQDILSEIEMTLSTLASKAGKLGVCVVALPLVISDEFKEGTASHPRNIRVTYRVYENPLVNNGAGGTLKAALSVCSRIHHVLKHYILGGLATGLVPADDFIVPIDDPMAPVTYEVSFNAMENVDQNFVKCAWPDFDYDAVTGILQLTCSTPDVTIYYTLDGGYPHPTNPNGFTVVQYTGPITIEGEVLVRAGAYKEGYLPSNINAARFNLIGDDLGGALAEEGGGALAQS